MRAAEAKLVQHRHVHVLRQLVSEFISVGHACSHLLKHVAVHEHRQHTRLVVADGGGLDDGHSAQHLQALHRLHAAELEDAQAVLDRAVRVAHDCQDAAAVIGHVSAI